MDENATQLEFKVNNNKKYKIESIWDSAVYAKKLEAGHLPKLYYLVFLERLSRRRKYLETFFDSYASSEDGQHFSQKLSKEANGNISTLRLYSIYGKANNQTLCKAKTRMPSKKCYKAH